MDAFAPRAKGRSWLDNGADASVADLNASLSQSAAIANAGARIEEPAEEGGPAVDDVQPSTMSDLDWMRARMKKSLDEPPVEKAFVQDDSDMEDVDPPPPTSKSLEPTSGVAVEDSSRPVMQTRRLFLRNLAYVCTEDEIRAEFSRFGTIEQVRSVFLHPLLPFWAFLL